LTLETKRVRIIKDEYDQTGNETEKRGFVMRKILTAIALTLLAAAPLTAATRGVVAELFTATW
jgi:hypothetical protein